MRIALEISGSLRTYLKNFPLFEKNIINPLEKLGKLDIFISTWDKIDTQESWSVHHRENGQPVDININLDGIKYLYKTNYIDIERLDSTKSIFNSSKITGTDYKCPDYRQGNDDYMWITSMWYKIWKCNEYKRGIEKIEDFKYDWVIRVRPDISLTKPIELGNNPDILTVTHIDSKPDNACSTVMFWASSELMDKTCDLFYHLNTLLLGDIGSERLFKRYLDQSNIQIQRMNPLNNYCNLVR